MMTLKAVSLFSGCGGFDLGVSQAGVRIVWANDIEPAAAEAYRQILPNVDFYLGDIQSVKSFPSADILIGCYPCTGFSVAARRRWKSSEERDPFLASGNFLFLEFVRALESIRPSWFLAENVRGMLTAGNGWFFNEQLKRFQTAGYHIKWKLLTAADYGVPQERRRVFIVGERDDIQSNFQFPEATYGPDKINPWNTQRDALASLPSWASDEYLAKKFHGHYLTRNRKRSWDSVSYTIVANESHVPLHPSGEPMKYIEKDRWTLQGEINRRFSWRECAVLQGLPWNIELTSGLASKYKIIGNAVPPAFGSVLAKSLLALTN